MSLENFTTMPLYQRLGAFKFALLLLIVFGLGIYAGKKLNFQQTNQQQQTIANLQNNLDQLYREHNQLEQKFNILNVELQVEKLANQTAQSYIEQSQDEEYALRRKLSFYQKLMAPELEASGVVIEGLEIQPTTSDNYYRFKLTLVQTKQHEAVTQGTVELYVQGSENRQPKEYDLIALAALDEYARFKFKYFDIVEGQFQLPENFIPEQVVVNVNLQRSKWQKGDSFEQSYPWSEQQIFGILPADNS